jgi:hypothetical protein
VRDIKYNTSATIWVFGKASGKDGYYDMIPDGIGLAFFFFSGGGIEVVVPRVRRSSCFLSAETELGWGEKISGV